MADDIFGVDDIFNYQISCLCVLIDTNIFDTFNNGRTFSTSGSSLIDLWQTLSAGRVPGIVRQFQSQLFRRIRNMTEYLGNSVENEK